MTCRVSLPSFKLGSFITPRSLSVGTLLLSALIEEMRVAKV